MKGKIMNKIIKLLVSLLVLTFFTNTAFSVDMPKVPKVGIGGGGIKQILMLMLQINNLH